MAVMNIRKAAAVLDKDKKTVIRWTEPGGPLADAKLGQFAGRNGAIILDADKVHALAATLTEAEESA